MSSRGLVILQVDGLGFDDLLRALDQGHMPFVQHLVEAEGYEALRHRCGVPSTTPFAQAGILYGDNSEIPAFRWWDKESGVPVTFGGLSTFGRVANKYFQGCEPLVEGGAAIATCFPDSASTSYHLAYRERRRRFLQPPFSARRALFNWVMNPLHLLDWMRRGLYQAWRANLSYWNARRKGQPASRTYVVSDMLEEILLHQLTRVAVLQAMAEDYPVIYAAFYAYDETAHAFGPHADYSFRILRHIDNTIRQIAKQREPKRSSRRSYELVLLSDHGQVKSVRFEDNSHRRFGEVVSEWFPSFQVEELKGGTLTPPLAVEGHIALAYSGGLAHWYFKDVPRRMQEREIEEQFPGLIQKIAHLPGIDFVLVKGSGEDVIFAQDERIAFDGACELPPQAVRFFGRYDKPEVIRQQLHKLNSFERSGDLILFGAYAQQCQVNFEDQVGGHGSLGGEQQYPFVLAKRKWELDTAKVVSASDLYPVLRDLRDRLAGARPARMHKHASSRAGAFAR